MSNLFDESSLAMIPTAYKDGRLYSVRPVPVYGPEEVTNGDFATDSDWNKGTGSTISGGVLSHSGATSSDTTQYLSITEKEYRLEYTIVSGSGSIRFWSNINAITPNIQSGVGTYVHYFTYDSSIGTDGRFAIALYDDISIDNVSIKEVSNIGDFTFSRGSNLSATRVNASQLIEKGRENLLLQSNQFDTTWTTGATLTSGQSGYNGNNAWKFASSSGGQTGVQQSVSFSNIHTFSVYAKAGSVDFIKLFVVQSGTNRTCVIDLSDGSIAFDNSVSASSPAASVTSLANGWYRIEMPTNANSATFVRIRPQLSEGDDNLSVGDFIYIQDTQVEQSLVATPYIETGASTAQAGILENTPRLDYSGGASCPSLLLEPSRTNIIPFSEYYNAGSWLKLNSSITDNATTSPEGFVNASLQTENSSAGFHAIYDNITAAFNTPFTFSAFVKPNGRDIVYLRMENASTGGGLAITYFNINTGQILSDSSTSSSIDELPNGWYRLSITGTTSASTSTLFVMGLASADDTRSYTGNGISGAYFYGASAESGSYPTSYIPTYGVSQTRAKDVCVKTGISDLIGQTEGTAFIELNVTSLASAGAYAGFRIFDGTNANKLEFIYYPDGRLQAVSFVGGALVANINLTSYGLTTGVHKFALAYKLNDYVLYVDGVNVGVDTSASVPATSQFDLFRTNGGLLNYKQATLFKTRLTNAELAALTTI